MTLYDNVDHTVLLSSGALVLFPWLQVKVGKRMLTPNPSGVGSSTAAAVVVAVHPAAAAAQTVPSLGC
jgi:hypothetical protein